MNQSAPDTGSLIHRADRVLAETHKAREAIQLSVEETREVLRELGARHAELRRVYDRLAHRSPETILGEARGEPARDRSAIPRNAVAPEVARG